MEFGWCAELQMWKEALLAYFKAKYRHLYGRSEGNHENPTELQPGYLPSTCLKLHCVSRSARSDSVRTTRERKLTSAYCTQRIGY